MKTISSVAITLCIAIGLGACSPKMTFLNSTVAPAATGKIQVKKDKNANYTLTVNVLNLAEPKQLTPAKSTYLVWAETNENAVKKLGQILPRGKSLSSELKATIVDKPNQIFITAEDNADISYPAGDVILTTRK